MLRYINASIVPPACVCVCVCVCFMYVFICMWFVCGWGGVLCLYLYVYILYIYVYVCVCVCVYVCTADFTFLVSGGSYTSAVSQRHCYKRNKLQLIVSVSTWPFYARSTHSYWLQSTWAAPDVCYVLNPAVVLLGSCYLIQTWWKGRGIFGNVPRVCSWWNSLQIFWMSPD